MGRVRPKEEVITFWARNGGGGGSYSENSEFLQMSILVEECTPRVVCLYNKCFHSAPPIISQRPSLRKEKERIDIYSPLASVAPEICIIHWKLLSLFNVHSSSFRSCFKDYGLDV